MKYLIVLLLSGLMVCAADRDVVINEIMYHPPDDLDNLQYVELHNHGRQSVNVSGWSFTKGIKFVFPANTVLNPGAFLVVARSMSDFSTRYGRELAVLGNFTGKLSHSGEELELVNAQKQAIDSVHFTDSDRWPRGPDGYSASLERISPASPGTLP